ncbi:hypothetical protein AMAG_06561 [Allomyces macrogynus ATCC 38327]|uniref:Uncharacterized protein n=1 Tax=Allomyces macrogynus (strain ATCC 38327) TaxID=578462 RepID=A0A0L0SGX6_ALLM3|nr:hypothetical protein AMAG_06561 [Allomyces macrogynus ATCC 38327]|eukprot:KNE61761.1 hypothetical protein AMAG_06561 [Allomyces macrogynus ATCC 38327]
MLATTPSTRLSAPGSMRPRPAPSAPTRAPAPPPPRFSLPMPARRYMSGPRFLPGHCFLCGACLRKLAAADSDTDPNNDPAHADAEYVDGHPPGRTPCARGPACRDARTPVMGVTSVRVDLKTLVHSRIYDTHLAPSPHVGMARACATDLKVSDMRWTFCRGAGGCYSRWLTMTKRLRKGNLVPAPRHRSRTASAPAAPAAATNVSTLAVAAGPTLPRHPRDADHDVKSASVNNHGAMATALAITAHSMAVARAQVVLQTHQLYLDVRERMHTLGYRRGEIDREIAWMRRVPIGVLGAS